jgi:uncharacterized protein (TIGR02594 family)
MSEFNFEAFMRSLRQAPPNGIGKVPQPLYTALLNALAAGQGKSVATAIPASPIGGQGSEPAWVATARALIGTAEIVGPKHNSKIVDWFRASTRLFNDDETPWCGAFMDHVFRINGIAPPKESFRAINWGSWGVPCTAQVGAVGVKRRTGGNHVFLIVGITADRQYYKALGGNQGNRVSIVDIRVSETNFVRWPSGVDQMRLSLPVMPSGTISRNEA